MEREREGGREREREGGERERGGLFKSFCRMKTTKTTTK